MCSRRAHLTGGTFDGMVRNLAEIEREIPALSNAECLRLLKSLIDSLDGPPDSGAEAAWDRVAGQRLDEVETGTAKIYSVQDVVGEARNRLKNAR